MFRKSFVLVLFLAMIANYRVFPQSVAIDAALSNAVKDISKGVPNGSKIAILNITSDSTNLSDYIINELIVNLVNTRLYRIVPRSTVELAAARREFAFQMSGDVSDDSQKRVGKFLEADTIITGSVTRDTANTYRLIINAIHLENFTFQSSFKASIQNDRQVKTLIADSGGVFYEDYTTGERIGMGALNMFFGIGSIMNGQKLGWLTTSLECAGIALVAIGFGASEKGYEAYWLVPGFASIGVGVLFGYIIPFFHHKPNNNSISYGNNQFPFNFELVSSNNQEINGIRILYKMRF